ncbi:MAG: hypothetical protein AAFN77_18840 [Planctomycetota bacterium]
MNDIHNPPTLFHDPEEIHEHNNEVVGFTDANLVVAVCRKENKELYDLVPLAPSEITNATIKLVFLPHRILFGALLSAAGVGWFWGFFAGWIPVIYYVVAALMAIGGLGMMLVCFENRAYFDTREGVQIRSLGIGEFKDDLRDWLREKGVTIT